MGEMVVINPGMFTTVQDSGRIGWQQYGVTSSGPMDERAFVLANILVGNPEGAACLEMTLSGGTYRFTGDTVIALTGADMAPRLNGKPIAVYRSVAVKAGDELRLGFVRNGCRSYLAAAGGLASEEVMGSRAALVGKGLAGLCGRTLQAGDRIPITEPARDLTSLTGRGLPRETWPDREILLRVVAGPQDDGFSREDYRSFFWHSAVITGEFNRQGCRLQREGPIRHLGDGNIISDGIAFGSIQVPPNGQPIIMLADRQTVGGYPKIGTVISVDLPLLAQSRPGMKVRFVEVGMELAQDLYVRELRKRKGQAALCGETNRR